MRNLASLDLVGTREKTRLREIFELRPLIV